jgi:hypothetical protein
MRYGDLYYEYIFSTKAYPHANKPLPLSPAYATQGVSSGSARTGSKTPANASSNKGGM